MKFLPYERLIIYSQLTQESAIQKLIDVVDSASNRNFRASVIKPYRGEIIGYKFKIRRVINYRNSFLPVIQGEIKSAKAGCCIDLKMRLNLIVICFLFVWSSPLIYSLLMIFIVGIIQLIQLAFPELVTVSGSIPLNIIFVLFGMILFCYCLATIFFKIESTKSKVFLQKLFN
ncbi:hypothetical protein [Calothrix sp. UHCC 0171]|uniref:hypothetical protein n=1 Tax=Calothrix sp. UHCC 0171 TaxID=3110245 RepID=UPI002B1F063E|nr:hypothetical protein [Calothrix sp. UHCC 0171]MEA5570375.1 hypothetical protein [Calothrix sp. UHCC 0171]